MNAKTAGSAPLALTILICTHNRQELLSRVLASLNAAERPACPVKILVVANACTDGTVDMLRIYQGATVEAETPRSDGGATRTPLPMTWLEEIQPGKSHALNTAIAHIDTELTAFVDDDHRVDVQYLTAIIDAAQRWPTFGLVCGRILPDWDGTEPAWVHDDGPYRVYPLPVPRYDQGQNPKEITRDEGPIPGGGNLVVRRAVFQQAGQFSTELGPRGHDLGGGEDTEYVIRAMNQGVQCQYVPTIIQHHYVDVERLRFSYLLRKGYQRTRSTARIHGNGRVPFYMWRKLFEYAMHTVFSTSWAKTRFYCVRTSAALGEIRGRHESGAHFTRAHNLRDAGFTFQLLLASTWLSGAAALYYGSMMKAALGPVVGVALLGASGLTVKSLSAFSQTGPRIRDEILAHFRTYSVLALLWLTLWAFGLMCVMGMLGAVLYQCVAVSLAWPVSTQAVSIAAAVAILGVTSLQFIRKMRFNPGLLVASMHYRLSRLYRVWEWATAARLARINRILIALGCSIVAIAGVRLLHDAAYRDLLSLAALAGFYVGLWRCAVWPNATTPQLRLSPQGANKPNVLMIGSDTLRADRLGAFGYRRSLTPNIDKLAERGTLFKNCHVPCARTAPSLISLLTGTWPHTHGVRDNFVTDRQARLMVPTLPDLLKPQGYHSAAISDWCGADMSKFSLGFDFVDLPEDQWSLKYLIRQGPKDIRLFVSIFTHNRLGWALFPELYYLGGVPQTEQLGKRSRRLLSALAQRCEPFFLNVFFSTTHPPFACEYPWYERFSKPDYLGESKFAMAKLTDPFEIIRRQGAPKEEFDLEQIIDLYDSCVTQFDSEVGLLLEHLARCGLESETIVVIYSDHGMEFFEHNTWGQGNSAIGDFSSRIPLLICDPRVNSQRCEDASVRSIDLAPTLLDLLAVPIPANIEGVSLASAVRGEPISCELGAFNETGFWLTEIPGLPENHLKYPDLLDLIEINDRETSTLSIKETALPQLLRAKDRMFRRGNWKLVYQPLIDGYQLLLFDVQADPNCTRNVIADHPSLGTAMWHELSHWIRPEERPS